MSFIAFLIAATVLAITPGPGIAYVVARTVAGGRAEGLASCIGTGLGGMLHVLAAAVGLALAVAQSALAFTLVKYLGAAYLLYLGVRMLMRKQADDAVESVPAQGARRALAEGIAVLAVHRLLDSGVPKAARARLMTRVSGVTMIGLAALMAWPE